MAKLDAGTSGGIIAPPSLLDLCDDLIPNDDPFRREIGDPPRDHDHERIEEGETVEELDVRLARHCPNEALHLGLVVVVVQAGADERVDSARGQIDPRQAGLVGVDGHGAQPVARLARRFAVLEKGDDPALLYSAIVHAYAGSLRELPP